MPFYPVAIFRQDPNQVHPDKKPGMQPGRQPAAGCIPIILVVGLNPSEKY